MIYEPDQVKVITKHSAIYEYISEFISLIIYKLHTHTHAYNFLFYVIYIKTKQSYIYFIKYINYSTKANV